MIEREREREKKNVDKKFYKKIPILGICLGHQSIYEAFGGEVTYSKRLFHGKSSNVKIDTNNILFKNLKKEFS